MEIWKYKFELGRDRLMIPISGRGVLSVGQDYASDNCLWVEVDSKNIRVPIDIISVGTGFHAPDDDKLRFIGTISDGPMRWHVFTKRGDE